MIKLAQLLKEAIISNKVVCDKCGWKWNIEDGGKDTYVCHKCGNDNTPIKEEKEPNHNFDRDMVVGVAEILRMVDDIDNRDDIADEMMDKFDREDVNYDVDEFLQMCGLNPLNEEETTAAPMLNKPKIPLSSKGVKKNPIPNREKAKTDTDKIKQQQLRLGIMRQQLKLPKSSQQRTRLQRRIVKANQKLTALKSGKKTS
jgi:hypothetical protein